MLNITKARLSVAIGAILGALLVLFVLIPVLYGAWAGMPLLTICLWQILHVIICAGMAGGMAAGANFAESENWWREERGRW